MLTDSTKASEILFFRGALIGEDLSNFKVVDSPAQFFFLTKFHQMQPRFKEQKQRIPGCFLDFSLKESSNISFAI